MLDLLNGPLATARIQPILTKTEATITDALSAEPNNQIRDVAGHFNSLRQLIADREANIRNQIANNNPKFGS
jgi:hypothetical protein